MRVLGQGFEDFVKTSIVGGGGVAATELEAALKRTCGGEPNHRESASTAEDCERMTSGRATSEMAGEWGPDVEDVFRVFLFTTFGAQFRGLNDVSTMMCNAGFADYAALPED